MSTTNVNAGIFLIPKAAQNQLTLVKNNRRNIFRRYCKYPVEIRMRISTKMFTSSDSELVYHLHVPW